MKANDYVVLCRAVEDGISTALARQIEPDNEVALAARAALQLELEESIMSSICEVFTFDCMEEV